MALSKIYYLFFALKAILEAKEAMPYVKYSHGNRYNEVFGWYFKRGFHQDH